MLATDVSTICAKLSSESSDRFFDITKIDHLTLRMASAQVVETSVAKSSPSQDSSQPDDFKSKYYVTPGFKPFSYSIKFADTN